MCARIQSEQLLSLEVRSSSYVDWHDSLCDVGPCFAHTFPKPEGATHEPNSVDRLAAMSKRTSKQPSAAALAVDLVEEDGAEASGSAPPSQAVGARGRGRGGRRGRGQARAGRAATQLGNATQPTCDEPTMKRSSSPQTLAKFIRIFPNSDCVVELELPDAQVPVEHEFDIPSTQPRPEGESQAMGEAAVNVCFSDDTLISSDVDEASSAKGAALLEDGASLEQPPTRVSEAHVVQAAHGKDIKEVSDAYTKM